MITVKPHPERYAKLKKYVTIDGVTKSLTEWAEIKGIHPSTIRCRVKRMGLTLEEAIKMETPDRYKRKNPRYTYQGKSLTLQGWSKRLNIPHRVLFQRIHIHNWTVEEAFSKPYRSK